MTKSHILQLSKEEFKDFQLRLNNPETVIKRKKFLGDCEKFYENNVKKSEDGTRKIKINI
jgi:hypothetical protein